MGTLLYVHMADFNLLCFNLIFIIKSLGIDLRLPYAPLVLLNNVKYVSNQMNSFVGLCCVRVILIDK